MSMDSDRTLVLMDANMLRSMDRGTPRYDIFDLGRRFNAIKDFIDKNKLSGSVILAVAEMTLTELLAQKKNPVKRTERSLSPHLQDFKNWKMYPCLTLSCLMRHLIILDILLQKQRHTCKTTA